MNGLDTITLIVMHTIGSDSEPYPFPLASQYGVFVSYTSLKVTLRDPCDWSKINKSFEEDVIYLHAIINHSSN